uniref:Uncharacterized protein n=1 Tax=Ditylenchus dipsaci TaxID=166011 RepID=A0A915DMZ6_9BILA
MRTIGGNITTPAAYMEIASYRDSRMRLFGLHGHTREFVLQKNNQHPERNLKAMFTDVIATLYMEHPSTKQFQIIIDADGLDNKIVIPPRPREQNTQKHSREIARVDQSARQANLMWGVLHVTALLTLHSKDLA